MSNELEKQGTAAFERPSFLPSGDVRGIDHLKKDDLQMPRLALAQALTPQVAEGKEGFATGVLFNSLTEEIYGKGPIDFTVIRADPPRWVEFFPREQGGGIKDMSVPSSDPRTLFTVDSNGKPVPPAATKFYDFVVLMFPLQGDPMERLIALSFKGTMLKTARQLNGLMKYRNAPSFAGRYTLTTAMTKNAKGMFAIYQVKNAGWVDEATFHLGEQLYDAIKDRTLTIEREPGEEETDFNPSNM